MISFDLKCDGGHVFEIWFRSSADYERQRAERQISCPYCGVHDVSKAVMAPAVGAKGNQRSKVQPVEAASEPQPVAAMPNGQSSDQIKLLISKLAEAQSRALAHSQWVGAAFAERARAMHYGEAEQAAIHGTASLQEAQAMAEEGLSIAPLLVPIAPPDQTN